MSRRPLPYHRLFQCLPFGLLAAATCGGQTLYQFGNPTAQEQSYIELINRARANPGAEGTRLANTTDPDVLLAYTGISVNPPQPVDLNMMKTEFNAIAAAPPLAPNAALTTAARGHSQWMLNNATQAHDETNPSNTFSQRITAAGYSWSAASENIFAYAKSAWHGHAGFDVDWGPGTGGMQSPRGHRTNIHNATYREIGVGVVLGSNGAVGPQLVTQDFGKASTTQIFGTGVAYYDLNSNSFYDIGEGIGGLTVNVSGATYYCNSAVGGGWVVPVPSTAATRTVTFSGLGINQTQSLVVPASTNAKVDLKLAYTPPVISSAATASAGSSHTVTFSAVGGATGYKLNRWDLAAAAAENCNSLTNVTAATLGSYSALNTAVKQEGSGSFHLVSPGIIGKQTIELKALFRGQGQSTPSLTFQSFLRYATSDEHYLVEVKEEGSSVWQAVYDQAGGTADAAFSAKPVNLPSMSGKTFRVRFALNFPSGSTYGSSGDMFGWFIDSISFTNTNTLANNVAQTLGSTSGSFTPTAGTYLVSVAPTISGIEFPGSDQVFTASTPVPSFATWASSMETSSGLAAGTIANNPNGDHDKDGRANLVEYAFGTSPVSAGESTSRMPALQPSATHFTVRYVRDTTLTDLTLVPVASSDFINWKSPGQSGAPVGFTDAVVSTAGNLETREAKIPFSSGARWAIRVQVVKP